MSSLIGPGHTSDFLERSEHLKIKKGLGPVSRPSSGREQIAQKSIVNAAARDVKVKAAVAYRQRLS
jgi:hypothetical protein